MIFMEVSAEKAGQSEGCEFKCLSQKHGILTHPMLGCPRAERPGGKTDCPVVSSTWRWVLKVLKLSAQGLPQSWISLEEAVLHYAADEVRWEMGAQVAVFHGGHNAVTGPSIGHRRQLHHRHPGRAPHQPV